MIKTKEELSSVRCCSKLSSRKVVIKVNRKSLSNSGWLFGRFYLLGIFFFIQNAWIGSVFCELSKCYLNNFKCLQHYFSYEGIRVNLLVRCFKFCTVIEKKSSKRSAQVALKSISEKSEKIRFQGEKLREQIEKKKTKAKAKKILPSTAST